MCQAKQEKEKVTIQEIQLLESYYFHQVMFILNQQTLFFSDLMNKFKQVPKKSSSLRLFKKSKERKAKNLSFLTPSKKYILIEEFTDEIKGLKNILNEIKKTRFIKRTRNKRNKK